MFNGWMSRKLTDPVDFMSPQNMGLMGLASGLLQSSGASPREITLGEGMGNGFQQGMAGMQQGMGMQAQQQHMEALRNQAEMSKHKLQQEMAAKELYRDTVQNSGTDDPVALGKMLMNSGDMGLAKIGMEMMKSKQVKQFMKGTDGEGKPTFYAGYNTGELSPTGVAPAEKSMQVNQGGQISLVDPYSRGTMGVSMAPGEQARLAQSAQQFGASHGLAQQNAELNKARTLLELDPQFQASRAGMIAGAKEKATSQMKASADLPNAVMQGEQTIKLVDDLLAHPGFGVSVGKTAPIGSVQSMIPGTDASSFNIALDQLKGKQFLEAFESLKGGGQITQIEGEKATQAMSRMNKANTEDEFIKASREFQGIIKNGIDRAKNKAGVQPQSADGWGDLR